MCEEMRTFKALSVKQPWANMIASGEKTIETRLWPTKYRGPLLIVSSRSPKIAQNGCAVALVNVADCRPMMCSDEQAARCEIYPGACAWILESGWPALHSYPFPRRLLERRGTETIGYRSSSSLRHLFQSFNEAYNPFRCSQRASNALCYCDQSTTLTE
jgi:ASCH domain